MKQFTLQTPQLTGLLAPMSNALSTSSALLGPLATLVAVSNGVNVLLWMVYVGLAVAGVVMMLLAARMVAARRSAEMAVRRARGASLAHLFWRGSSGHAAAGVLAAALAWALAVLLLPGPGPTGWVAWWPGIATLAVAVLGPGVAAAWQHRLPRRRRSVGRTRTMAQTLGNQSDLRGHRLRRGHRRNHRRAAAQGWRRPVYAARLRCSSRSRP